MSRNTAKPPTEDTAPVDTIQRKEGPVGPTTPYLVAFHYSGTESGIDRSSFDSRVVNLPTALSIATQKEIKDIAEALAYSVFQEGKRYVGMKLAIMNIQRLPIGETAIPMLNLGVLGTPAPVES